MGKAISKQLEKPLHLRRTPLNPLHIRVFDTTTPTKGGQMTPARLELNPPCLEGDPKPCPVKGTCFHG